MAKDGIIPRKPGAGSIDSFVTDGEDKGVVIGVSGSSSVAQKPLAVKTFPFKMDVLFHKETRQAAIFSDMILQDYIFEAVREKNERVRAGNS